MLVTFELFYQSPKKVNLVAALVRGMRVEDALLQLQLTVKRAAKTVYQVKHFSAVLVV